MEHFWAKGTFAIMTHYWQRVFQKMNSISKHYPYDVVVLEMADDELEDMLEFLRFINPKFSVITGVAPVHMERMKSMDKVINDNWLIAEQAECIIYNNENPVLKKLAQKNKASIGFGDQSGVVKFKNLMRNKNGYLTGDLVKGSESIQLSTKMIGRQNLNSLLSAALVADQMG
ncbi:MAG: hypothetical protein LC101_11355, partial [Flavobacteriales bacterium]|nr:hypothetical protein [Flavobacteriales bacterium]